MTKLRRLFKQNQKGGIILLSLLGLLIVMTMLGLTLMSYTTTQASTAARKVFSANATLVAEAGIEYSVYELNQDDDFAGVTTEAVFFNSEEQGRGVYTTTIADAAETNTKIITSVGEVYRFNDSSEPVSRVTLEATVVGTGSQGYSVHTGPGGLILSGSASITNSDVFVNGTISMSGAARIGTSSQPLDVRVAHKSCPTGTNPGPTYPQVCSSGNPISLAYSTFIYGSVCATNQTSTGPNPSKNIQTGSGGQGLIAGCVAPPVDPPTYNRANHIAAMTTTAPANSNTYVCNNWPFNRTWPANLRLNGNANVASSCNVVITGDTYITGNLDIGGAARITIAESVGTDRPVIVVDGNITLGGSAQIIANSQGTGAHFISFRSNASCNPNCTSLSGTELRTSQTLQTVTVGGAVNLPGMIFQSYWGTVRLGGSGNVGAAAGQRIDMSGAGTITFGTALSSGESTWTITSYKQNYD